MSRSPQVEPSAKTPIPARSWRPLIFSVAFGCLLGITLLKFGNPINLDKLIEAPTNIWEYLFQSWPLRWGYALLILTTALGLSTTRFQIAAPKWILILPAAWLGWQMAAAPVSIAPELTQVTVPHLGACVGCFYLGLFALGRIRNLNLFWLPMLVAFLFVLWTGFEQHYGGLEETRKLFYQQPDWHQYPADYVKRIESNRIFSTLVYPNALAGAILLLLPAMLLWTWRLAGWLTPITRGVLVGLVLYGGLACLYWSGSKSGWLIGLVLILAVLLRQPVSRTLKLAVVGMILLAGLAGFFVKFSGYFHRGAPSVSARFVYWQAGLHTALDHPVFGTGPGSFSAAFRKVKPSGAEMTQLVHNDYLEQASDSGVIGFLTYTTFIIGSMVMQIRRPQGVKDHEAFVVWLGLLGWTLQSFVEFLLYIPALAWLAFAFLGWLWGREG